MFLQRAARTRQRGVMRLRAYQGAQEEVAREERLGGGGRVAENE